MSKFANQMQRESEEFIFLDEFIQVDGKEFEGDALVTAEHKGIQHVNNVHVVLLILQTKRKQRKKERKEGKEDEWRKD